MRTSQRGIDLIRKYEGCRLTAYKPVASEKYWTIGIGHYGPDVEPGETITMEKAEEILRSDLAKFERAVNSLGRAWTQNQFDALASFTYNCGTGNLRKLVSNRTNDQIAEAMLRYTRGANNRVLQGLVRRRKEERELFLENSFTIGDYKVGAMYHTVTRLKVRKGPGRNYAQVKHAEMDPSETVFDNGRLGCIDTNTPVIPREVSKQTGSVWLRIGSGWVCAQLGTDIYVR